MPPAAQVARERLQHANRLMADGRPEQAASIFEALAEQAERQGIPRAPQLYLQAGRAWIEANETASGLLQLRKGLQLMHELGQSQRLQIAGARVLAGLRERNLTAEAQSLEAELMEMLKDATLPFAAAPPAKTTTHLPSKCPYCGGNVMPDTVEWIADERAVCDYCGTILETEA